MLSVNKNYCNEVLFERMMRKRYPLLVKYKNEEESWKRFYIRIIYYLSFLAEQGLPYIPHPLFDPEYLFNKYKYEDYKDYKEYLLDEGLNYAAGVGNMDLVRYFIDLGATNFDWAMSFAAGGGYLDVIKYLIGLGATDLENAMASASAGGHLAVVKYLVELGATNFGNAMYEATEGGHTDIIEYLKKIRRY